MSPYRPRRSLPALLSDAWVRLLAPAIPAQAVPSWPSVDADALDRLARLTLHMSPWDAAWKTFGGSQ